MKHNERALMALFDERHRMDLPGGYWVQKVDENRWQIGCGAMFLGFSLDSNVPVGKGGSMDRDVVRFVEAMQSEPYSLPPAGNYPG